MSGWRPAGAPPLRSAIQAIALNTFREAIRDRILYLLLVTQVVAGIYIAVLHPWGSSWFAASATPYLMSILKLNPDITYVMALPFMVKLHIVNAYLVVGFFPFTRLVHILVVPNPYFWRKPQVVRWNWRPRGRNRVG